MHGAEHVMWDKTKMGLEGERGRSRIDVDGLFPYMGCFC